MYARIVNMKFKNDGAKAFPHTFETEIAPMLRKQVGFRDQVNLLSTERSEVTGISFWNQKDEADEYSRSTYPGVLKSLSKIIDGTPVVKSFEVSSSTFHKIAEGKQS